MRIDNSINTNSYSNDVSSNKLDPSQQNQPETILLQKTENQEKSPSQNYFENLNNLGANFLAFKLKQATTSPKQNARTNSINITQKEEPKQNGSQVGAKSVSGGKVNSEELNTKSWADKGGKVFPNQNEYNKHVLEAVNDPKNPWPGFSPQVLKSIIAQESGFDPKANDGNGFIGLTQMNETTAKTEGKLSFTNGDPRTDPNKIIPATLKVLNLKSKALDVGFNLKNKSGKVVENLPGFNYYGKPNEQDRAKFAVAAYNAGQGAVLKALKQAYGDSIPKEVKYEDVEKFLPTKNDTKGYVNSIFERAEKN